MFLSWDTFLRLRVRELNWVAGLTRLNCRVKIANAHLSRFCLHSISPLTAWQGDCHAYGLPWQHGSRRGTASVDNRQKCRNPNSLDVTFQTTAKVLSDAASVFRHFTLPPPRSLLVVRETRKLLSVMTVSSLLPTR